MNRPSLILLGIFLLAGVQSLRAQQINPRDPPPPPPAAPAAPAEKPAAPPAAAQPPIDPTVPPLPPVVDDAPETPAADAGPVFDPLHAQRSLDVGTFYLKKGVYDAAIDRFIEASNYQPSLAMPWKLLGDAYEKKREFAKAADAYKKYLRILPNAPDAAKIKKEISDLEEKAPPDSSKKVER
jgi:tetratricopeptide (TPR) repeat protein